MNRKNEELLTCTLSKSLFHFIGDIAQGQRFEPELTKFGAKLVIETKLRFPSKIDFGRLPDFVLLDGFPDSKLARAAYYHYINMGAILFIALNETPYANRLMHINALSFMRWINRNPSPKELSDAIVDLATSNRLMACHRTEKSIIKKIFRWWTNLNRCEFSTQKCC